MAADLAQFEQENAAQIQMVNLNVDEHDSEMFRKYASAKESGYIPETVVMTAEGKVLYRQVGKMGSSQFQEALAAARGAAAE